MALAENFHPVSDKTARRVAEAVERYAGKETKSEEIKEFLTEHMLMTLVNAAIAYQDHAYGSSAGSMTSYAYENFVRAVRGLDNHALKGDYIALASSDFTNQLMRTAKFITDANISKVVNNGIIDRLAGVPLLKVSPMLLPSFTAFIVMTRSLYEQLYEMYRDGSIQTDANITDLVRAHDREIIVCRLMEELKFFESYSEKSETRNKSVICIPEHEKERTTNHLFYLTARNMDSLPVPEYGTGLAMSSSSDPWYNAVEMYNTTVEITPTASHTVFTIVETLSTLVPVAYSYGPLYINN